MMIKLPFKQLYSLPRFDLSVLVELCFCQRQEPDSLFPAALAENLFCWMSPSCKDIVEVGTEQWQSGAAGV